MFSNSRLEDDDGMEDEYYFIRKVFSHQQRRLQCPIKAADLIRYAVERYQFDCVS